MLGNLLRLLGLLIKECPSLVLFMNFPLISLVTKRQTCLIIIHLTRPTRSGKLLQKAVTSMKDEKEMSGKLPHPPVFSPLHLANLLMAWLSLHLKERVPKEVFPVRDLAWIVRTVEEILALPNPAGTILDPGVTGGVAIHCRGEKEVL